MLLVLLYIYIIDHYIYNMFISLIIVYIYNLFISLTIVHIIFLYISDHYVYWVFLYHWSLYTYTHNLYISMIMNHIIYIIKNDIIMIHRYQQLKYQLNIWPDTATRHCHNGANECHLRLLSGRWSILESPLHQNSHLLVIKQWANSCYWWLM